MVSPDKQTRRKLRLTANILALSASVITACSTKTAAGKPEQQGVFRFNDQQLTHIDSLAKMGSLGLHEYRYEIGRISGANLRHKSQTPPARGPNGADPRAPLMLHRSLISVRSQRGGFSYRLTPAALPFFGSTITVHEATTEQGDSSTENVTFTNPDPDYFHDERASVPEIIGFFRDSKTRLSRYSIRQAVSTYGKCQLSVELDTKPATYNYTGICSNITRPDSAADLYQELSDLLY